MTKLLPHLEQSALWEEALRAFQSAQFFEDAPHRSILGRPMMQFLCPLEPRQVRESTTFNVGFTSYLGISGEGELKGNGLLYLDSTVRMSDVIDGLSTTLIVGERPPSRDGRFGWWYAGWGSPKHTGRLDLYLGAREHANIYKACHVESYHFVPGADDDCDTFHFWSRHPGGAHFVLCDGSARFLAYSVDPMMPMLATRAGGEPVRIDD